MSQETNLNVAPYFDDFNANNDYYKVLFKPAYPVQARELNNLQSILQNQVEKLGQHFFKDGAKVIPGNTSFNTSYYAIELEDKYLGIPLSDYINQVKGSKITGLTSGVTAIVDKVLLSRNSEKGRYTLYVNYVGSNSADNSSLTFLDNELLSSNEDILSANTIIPPGEAFASTGVSGANSIGSSFSISNGIYFARGNFVTVQDETILLDQYSNTPSYRIGLFLNEQIINSDIDPSLNDNARGFTNYAAPGADRFKITTSLFKKALDDYDDNNFIELATIENGVLKSQKESTEYNILQDELARRTYEESGDYYIKPFNTSLKESLNNYKGNNGIFNANQTTYSGGVPSDDLALYNISPGKAYVKGYEIEKISSTYLDVKKPRTTKSLEDQGIDYHTGSTIKLNRFYGSPKIGIGNTYVLSLRDKRVGAAATLPAGKEIGVARVYDVDLESGSYDRANSNTNEWDLILYDVQTVTEITLNEPITLAVPTHIKGKYSGATAFLKDAATNTTSLSVYEVEGEFVQDENFVIDGVENTRVAIAVTTFGISDIKSVFGNTNGSNMNTVGAAQTFSADTIQTPITNIGVATITPHRYDSGLSGYPSGSISTVRSTNPLFPGDIKVGNILQFSPSQTSEFNDPILASVVSVGTTHVVMTGVHTVSGVADGKLPDAITQVSDLKVVGTDLLKSDDNSFYTILPKRNIENVDLTDASLTIRKSQSVRIVGNQLSEAVSSGSNQTFLPFTPERYSLIKSDGTTETLTSDKVQFNSGSTEVNIFGLSTGTDDATLITTIKKLKPKSKKKIRNRVNSIIVDKSTESASGIGSTTLNDGLTFGNYPFGTRVQDDRISLNVADLIEIQGIYESVDTGNPSAPSVVISALTGPTGKTSDLIIGEQFKGKTTNSCAIVAERISDSKITFIPKNDLNFKEGEVIRFEESKIEGVVTTLDTTDFNITSNFTTDNGQNQSFYNYPTINRKTDVEAPEKRLKIYFSNGYYESTDDGDITTIDSYSSFDYGTQIPLVNGVRNTDLIDIRPRVSDYTVAVDTRSPLEFFGREFNASGNSAANILASDETIVIDFSWYLGRIDCIYVTKDGSFQVNYGTPSENPQIPTGVDDALKIATAYLPPYLFNVEDASINFFDYKRYKMSDINRLENRIKSLEYYTSLSLLETNTASLFLPDSAGLNRFKAGFFVDNFTSFLAQSQLVDYKNSIDISNNELRPRHYTTGVDLELGPVEGVNPAADKAFINPQGNNIKRTGDIITLNYNEVEWFKQTAATRSESVTPFILTFWTGTVELTPASDNWLDTQRLDANVINVEGNFAEEMAIASRDFGVDPQTGFAATVWNSWETLWGGTTLIGTGSQTNVNFLSWASQGVRRELVEQFTVDTFRRDEGQLRTGTRVRVTEQLDQTSQGDRLVSRDLITFMRSRNVQFVAKRVKPNTQLYGFFDGVDVTKYCVPKLLEIAMVSGTFQVGETVTGTTRPIGSLPVQNSNSPEITFRVAVSNHLEGPYNAPTKRYGVSPYSTKLVPASYSSTSTTLNIDTFSLSNQPQGSYFGWVEEDMILVGETSGALATISNVRLISDISSNLLGSFWIPDPNMTSSPRFETGDRTLRFINNETNDRDNATTLAEQGFSSTGILEVVQEDIISVRNAVRVSEALQEERTINETFQEFTLDNSFERNRTMWVDPLAQSFTVEDNEGVFLTSCDVFFATKDDTELPVTMQLRTMQGGQPTTRVIPFSEVSLDPNQVAVSSNGSLATTFTFKSPVYLEGGIDYCVVLLSESAKYGVYISRVGETDLLTETFISTQPYLGSLFKSQNASTWEPSQWEDLKFTLYRADFASTGSLELYSPELTKGNKQIATLLPNPLNLSSRQLRVGIGSTLNDSDLKFGYTIKQRGSNATGTYVNNAGIATGTLNIINAGIGLTPLAAGYVFTDVPLTNVTSSGGNATADITVSNGVAVAATIATGGDGYVAGDVLGIATIGNNSLGSNVRLSVVSIANTTQLILDNVQGDFATGVGKTVQYIRLDGSTGITTDLNGANNVGGNVTISDTTVVNSGLNILVNHKNHGMYFDENYVTLSDVESDIIPTKLVNDLDTTTTGEISVDDVDNLDTFENVGVGTTNYGYLKIGEEILSYESASGSVIGITSRSIDSTTAKNYLAGTLVYKYELDGVSLRRINKTHNLDDVTIADPITFDSYNIKLDMGSSGLGRSTGESFPILYTSKTKTAGGSEVTATQNIPFELIRPAIQNMTVPGTNISAQMRTISGASLDGTETPFEDQGFETVTLGENNVVSTPRIIASRINETNNLSTLPGNKSFNMRLNLTTASSKLSPVIDSQRMSAFFTSNRVNSAISNYVTDNRVNTLNDDPTAFQYLSKEVQLENPGTSIKILLNAYLNTDCDIRAFYAISNSENFTPIYLPFPGFNNLNERGEVINQADNDGRSDAYVAPTANEETLNSDLEFKERSFTMNDLPSFKFYRVKILMTSTNQVYVPRMKDLRVLALA
tara:strand:- start:3815 stop:11296 length:7482 start_codon:yes stop_codon:yes gene_type:complete